MQQKVGKQCHVRSSTPCGEGQDLKSTIVFFTDLKAREDPDPEARGHRRTVTREAHFCSKKGGNLEYLELSHQEIGYFKKEDAHRNGSVGLLEKPCRQTHVGACVLRFTDTGVTTCVSTCADWRRGTQGVLLKEEAPDRHSESNTIELTFIWADWMTLGWDTSSHKFY